MGERDGGRGEGAVVGRFDHAEVVVVAQRVVTRVAGDRGHGEGAGRVGVVAAGADGAWGRGARATVGGGQHEHRAGLGAAHEGAAAEATVAEDGDHGVVGEVGARVGADDG